MCEVDLSTYAIIGLDDNTTKVITENSEYIVNMDARKYMDISCRFFGYTLLERVKYTSRLINFNNKVPIIIEDFRNIIFFPIKSPKEKNNIWISFRNLKGYKKGDNNTTVLIFKNKKNYEINASFYIVDNQYVRSTILDYKLLKNKKKLKYSNNSLFNNNIVI